MNKYDDTDYLIEREESIEYEEGSDINVGSIEKDIKRCEELIKPEHANWIGISNQLAIAGLLHRIKETDNDLTTVYLKGYEDCRQKYMQKVKDKIEENNKIMIDTQNKYPGTYAMLDEWRNAKAQNDILEDLLEEK